MIETLGQGFLLGLAYAMPIGAQNLYVINSASRGNMDNAMRTALGWAPRVVRDSLNPQIMKIFPHPQQAQLTSKSCLFYLFAEIFSRRNLSWMVDQGTATTVAVRWRFLS